MPAPPDLKQAILVALTQSPPTNAEANAKMNDMAEKIALAVDVYVKRKLGELISILVTPGLYVTTAPRQSCVSWSWCR